MARSLQTKGSAAERAANPQYVNDDAYTTLGRAVYPWSLPFDLWADEARSYLGHLGVPRYRIMETFRPGSAASILNDTAVAREHLGLTSAQADLITGVTTSQPGAADPGAWNLWGFETKNLKAHSIPDPSDNTLRIAEGNWLDVLTGRVDVFLQQSGLKYKEMLDLLNTRYVNPLAGSAGAIRVVSTDAANPDTCETDELSLVGFGLEAAKRTVRFVRLWRALGWTMRDLDRAITAFASAELDDALVTRLSHIRRLNEALNVPVQRLLSWWADIDIALYIDHSAPGQPPAASLYDQLFRNRASVNPLDPGITENPAKLAGTLSSHAAAIIAALGISAADFALLLDDANVIPRTTGDPARPDDTLSLKNLSQMHRHVSLAKALRLSMRDYLATIKLIARNPFAATADTLIFMETIDKALGYGFSFPELDYILRHAITLESVIAPSDEIIATLLDELRAGLQKIAEENIFRVDADDPAGPTTDLNGDLTRQKLALLYWDRALIDQAVATLNGAVIYEAPLVALPSGVVLPNAAGVYAVGLAALPVGFTIPVEIRDAVAYDAATKKLTALRFLTKPEREVLGAASKAAANVALTSAVVALFREQDELQGGISHDTQRHVLGFTGAMTTDRKARLDSVSDNASYLAAVQLLYEAPRSFISRAMRTFAVHDFDTNLTALPKTVKFPNALKRKVYFDTATDPKRVHCVGVMSGLERDALLALSTNDADAKHVDYQAAVNDLYSQPDALAPEAADIFLTATGSGNDAAAFFDASVTPGDRFLLVLAKLIPYLRRSLSEQLAVQKLAEALQLESRTGDALLRTWLASPVDPKPSVAPKRRCLAELLDPAFVETNTNVQITPTAFPAQFKTFVRAHKAAMVATRLKLTHRQLGWLFMLGPDAG